MFRQRHFRFQNRIHYPDVHRVSLLTKDQSGLSYEEYLARVRANPIACRVKVADMLHNLSDSPTQKQILKYARGLLILLEGQEKV